MNIPTPNEHRRRDNYYKKRVERRAEQKAGEPFLLSVTSICLISVNENIPVDVLARFETGNPNLANKGIRQVEAQEFDLHMPSSCRSMQHPLICKMILWATASLTEAFP
ncbi:MAG: hypothetical protein Q8N56_04645 [bacterium]|nr:hypothetical protein [bacterium]